MAAEVPAKFVNALGLEKGMFEAADPAVFAWYVKNYGPEVNLFVDHSQIVQLECLRSGIWGTASLWGRVVTYKGGVRPEGGTNRPRERTIFGGERGCEYTGAALQPAQPPHRRQAGYRAAGD